MGQTLRSLQYAQLHKFLTFYGTQRFLTVFKETTTSPFPQPDKSNMLQQLIKLWTMIWVTEEKPVNKTGKALSVPRHMSQRAGLHSILLSHGCNAKFSLWSSIVARWLELLAVFGGSRFKSRPRHSYSEWGFPLFSSVPSGLQDYCLKLVQNCYLSYPLKSIIC
jgi:hypothetical protein